MREQLQSIRAGIREACRQAGRAEESVRLIGVSKTKSADMIRGLASLGVKEFGENYVQEALPKIEVLAGEGLRWHFIGGLQSNKAKLIPGKFSLLHTLDSLSLAEKLNQAAEGQGLVQDCLLAVNISGEGTKSGLDPAACAGLLEKAGGLTSLNVLGLMCIPAPGSGRAPFARLRELMESLNRTGAYPRPLRELSMGMSTDFREAILEGSTMVRIGTALFGERE